MPRVTNRVHDSATLEVPATCCRNCHRGPEEHLDGKCLFDATVWEQMTKEEYDAWVRNELAHLTGVTTGRLSSREPNIQLNYKWKVHF